MRLADIYILCQTSQDFYQFAAGVSESYSMKRLFLQRAEIRHQARLNIATPPVTRLIAEPRIANAVRWYHAARDAAVHFDQPAFLQLLEQQEIAQLELVKKAVKEAHSIQTMHRLAELATEIVMSRDELLRLQLSSQNPVNFTQ